MSTIKEESIKQESNDNESTGSAETPMSALTSQFSRALTLGKSKQMDNLIKELDRQFRN
jgi:hypothetical protein